MTLGSAPADVTEEDAVALAPLRLSERFALVNTRLVDNSLYISYPSSNTPPVLYHSAKTKPNTKTE